MATARNTGRLEISPPLGAWLARVLKATSAAAGAVWQIDNGSLPRVLTQSGLGADSLEQAQQQWPGHLEKLTEAHRLKRARSMTAQFEQSAGAPPVSLRILLIPLPGSDQVLELFLGGENQTPLTEIEQAVATLQTAASAVHDPAYVEWLSRIHAQPGVEKTCVALANETRAWSGWDRVSVAVRQKRAWRVESISGLESFDRRSAAVRELDQLVAGLGQDFNGTAPPSLWVNPGASTDSRLTEFAAKTGARQTAVLPLLKSSGALCGMLVFESLTEGSNPRPADQLPVLAPQAGRALEQALAYDRARTSLVTQLFGSGLISRRAMIWLGLIAAGLILCLLPVDIVITGTGRLEPEQQQDLFAGQNGIVAELLVKHAQKVKAGAPLIHLRSPELDLEMTRLQGELQTVIQQIGDLETLRSDPRRAVDQGQSVNELAAKGEEYRTIRNSLEAQIQILKRQQEALYLKSPMTGTVLTWDVAPLLTDRPVARTDRLLTVANLEGPWVLTMQVDHRDTGPVIDAIEKKIAQVSAVTADAPERPLPATIREVAPRLEIDPVSGPTLAVTAEISPEKMPQVRPGATVIYRIRCGTAPAGKVWFRRVIDRVTAWWRL